MAPNQVLLTQFVKPINREEQEAELKELSPSISLGKMVEDNNVVSTNVKKQLETLHKLLLLQMTLLNFHQHYWICHRKRAKNPIGDLIKIGSLLISGL